MTKEQAYEKLELPVGTDLQVVRQKFNQMHNEFLMQIDGVSFNPAMKQRKEQQLEELKEAYALLNESEGMDDSASLPRTERTFDHGGGETRSSSSEPKHTELTREEALAVFDISGQDSPDTATHKVTKHLASLQEQYSSVQIPAAKELYQREIDKAEKAKILIEEWIVERDEAARAEQERLKQERAAVPPLTEQPASQNTSTLPPAKKKNNALVYIIPALLLVGAGVYFVTRSTGTDSSALDVHAAKDSSAWEMALTSGNTTAYESYIKQFPEGIFATAAKIGRAHV